jgi:hypothetical protein
MISIILEKIVIPKNKIGADGKGNCHLETMKKDNFK